jgi:hypothetical protein
VPCFYPGSDPIWLSKISRITAIETMILLRESFIVCRRGPLCNRRSSLYQSLVGLALATLSFFKYQIRRRGQTGLASKGMILYMDLKRLYRSNTLLFLLFSRLFKENVASCNTQKLNLLKYYMFCLVSDNPFLIYII